MTSRTKDTMNTTTKPATSLIAGDVTASGKTVATATADNVWPSGSGTSVIFTDGSSAFFPVSSIIVTIV